MEITTEHGARTCGSCTLCCRLPEIETLAKPPDVLCRHCTGESCAIYADRPQLCRDFLCLWMTDGSLADHWQPLRSHMLVYEQGPQLTVLADPDHPGAWRKEPFASDLLRWTEEAERNGRYVVLFCGDDVTKIGAA
ncbi:hypothetical protein [Rhizobium terrae]|uniref:hypothetical protein n=1 Tax=Rhizobium terrae TaxID=2171756 RepID=UPI001D0209AC|nr:hypothetical protein [Rhizobium terrae]